MGSLSGKNAVVTGSTSGIIAEPNHLAYSASKSSVIGLTRYQIEFIERARLQLFKQDLERFGYARLAYIVAVYNAVVGFKPAHDVVRLNGKHFLKNVRRAVSFERPNFHFAEALSAELRFTA